MTNEPSALQLQMNENRAEAERILAFIGEQGDTITTFAAKIGMAASTVYGQLVTKSRVADSMRLRIYREYGREIGDQLCQIDAPYQLPLTEVATIWKQERAS